MVEEEREETVEETPTESVEEVVKRLQAEVTEAREKAEAAEKGLRSAHQKLTQKDVELKKRDDFSSQFEDLNEKIKILAAAQSMGQTVSEGDIDEMTPTKKNALLQQFEELDKKKKAEAEQRAKETELNSYKQEADALWAEANELLASDEEKLERVELALSAGRTDIARKHLDKVRAEKSTDTSRESEEALKARLRKEIREEEGLEVTDTAIPSGRSGTRDEAQALYAEGKISREDYEKRTGKEGI